AGRRIRGRLGFRARTRDGERYRSNKCGCSMHPSIFAASLEYCNRGVTNMRAHLTAAATIVVTAAIAAQPRAANNSLTAVPGIAVGHYTLSERSTGCTAIVVERGAMAGVDVR